MKNLGLLIVILVMNFQVSSQTEERYAAPAIPPPPMPIVVTGENDIVEFPEVDASFPGGAEAMKKWIEENLSYPERALKNGEQGRVYVSFVVEKDGSISNVEILRSITIELNQEAIRLVQTMPKWTPGESDGKLVRARCRLPISFAIE